MRYGIRPDILFRNERQINILETQNFGRLGFVEVGALSVGRIIQVHPYDTPFQARGGKVSIQFWRIGGRRIRQNQEFGAPADDILSNTKKGIETRVLLGDTIAMRTAPRQ